MRERPILFSSPMVRAILDGRKTQTRRIVKPQPPAICETVYAPYKNEPNNFIGLNADAQQIWFGSCPYGQPGDRLWVRENWKIGAWDETLQSVACDYIADGFIRDEWIQVKDAEKKPKPGSIFAPRTTFERLQQQSLTDAKQAGIVPDENGRVKWEKSCSPCRIRPSIHMPRWASRILLEIVSVRVERLQEISREDAAAEGICHMAETNDKSIHPDGCTVIQRHYWPEQNYQRLWESINGPGSCDANPWVWVIEFKRVKP